MNRLSTVVSRCFLQTNINFNHLRLGSVLSIPHVPMLGSPLSLSTRCLSVKDSVNTDTTSVSGKFFNVLKSVFSPLLNRNALKRDAYLLYENMSSNINHTAFFKQFQMPDTFNSWFIVTELHVWMLMVRLMHKVDEGRDLRNGIVEAMWDDCKHKGKNLAPENPSLIGKQMQQLSTQFQMALIIYDEGIQSSDIVLTGALWYRFFNKECQDPRHLEILVSYVRNQLDELYKVSDEEIRAAKNVQWTRLQYHVDTVLRAQ